MQRLIKSILSIKEKFSKSSTSGSENRRMDDIELSKVDKTNWAKIIEATSLHLKFIRGVRGIPLT